MKKFGIIGSILFVVAVVLGQFFNFPGSTVVSVALASFGLASVIIGAVKSQKEKADFSIWKTVVVLSLAVVGGVLCCIGGLNQTIFEAISGAVIALLSIILGIYYDKK